MGRRAEVRCEIGEGEVNDLEALGHRRSLDAADEFASIFAKNIDKISCAEHSSGVLPLLVFWFLPVHQFKRRHFAGKSIRTIARGDDGETRIPRGGKKVRLVLEFTLVNVLRFYMDEPLVMLNTLSQHLLLGL